MFVHQIKRIGSKGAILFCACLALVGLCGCDSEKSEAIPMSKTRRLQKNLVSLPYPQMRSNPSKTWRSTMAPVEKLSFPRLLASAQALWNWNFRRWGISRLIAYQS